MIGLSALLVSLTLAAAAPAPLAPAAAPAPPAAWFAVDRAFGSEAAPTLAAELKTALAREPENIWLHDAWQRLHSRPPLHDGRLEVEYRAFLAQAPASPLRQTLLALALVRAHANDRESKAWAEEVGKLVEGLRGAPGLEAWVAVAESLLKRSQDDRAGRRQVVETAWSATQGHLALVPARAALASRDEAELARFTLEVAEREPRFVGRLFDGHTPPLAADAIAPMRKVADKLARMARQAPRDAELAWALHQTAVLLEDRARADLARASLRALDPAWRAPDSSPSGSDVLAAAAFSDRLSAAVSSPPDKAPAAFAALEPEVARHPDQAARFYLQWAQALSRGPARDPKRAAELYRKSFTSPDPGSLESFARLAFARLSAEAGQDLDEAAKLADEAVRKALDSLRADRGASGGSDDREGWARKVADALEVRGAVALARGDASVARTDFVVASLVSPDSGTAFARLADAEERLGHRDDALDAWIGAVARGAYEPERLAEWKKRLEVAADGRLLWASADEVVAAEKARLAARKGGGASSPASHPLVGQPAPEFEVEKLGGGVLASSTLKGKPMIVDFWATWCGPCKLEMPVLQRLHEKYSSRGVSFVMLSTDDDTAWKESVAGFIKGMGITMPVGRAPEAVQSAYRVGGIPSLFLVGKDGKVSRHHLGFEASVEAELDKEIEAALR